MKLIKSIVLSGLFLAVIFIAGCNEQPTTSNEPVNTGQQISKFSLPPGATLTSAFLHIHTSQFNGELVNIYGVSSDWDETTVTWNTKPSIFATPVEGSFTPNAYDWIVVDITGLVGKWLDETYANYGLLLDQASTSSTVSSYYSKENFYPPYLEVFYTGGTAIVQDIADAYISELDPDVNFNYGTLYTGFVDGLEKQSLLKFDIEYVPGGGCTLTPGYWKTHSEFGPAPYDDTWAQLPNGASTTFFLSGKTYYQVLWTSPRGNAYYNLSFQYIAAQLNFLHGASVPAEVQTAYNDARALFNAYTPAEIGALKGNQYPRPDFIRLAGILGDYNSGITGPGHCDD